MASQLQQEGLLITNEIYPQRAKILSQNIERMGIKNAVVVNESPQKLAKHFPYILIVSLLTRHVQEKGCLEKMKWHKKNGV